MCSWLGRGRGEGGLCTRGNTSQTFLLAFRGFGIVWGVEKEGQERHTWLVHTLLNVTKAKVCASIVEGKSFFANRRGRATAERNNCGMKARDSSFTVWVEGEVGERYRSVL